MDKLRAFVNWIKTPRIRRIIAIIIALVLIAWTVYRFAAYYAMTRQSVFNATRAAVNDGVPVYVVGATRGDVVMQVPVTVRGNVARVSGATARDLRAGTKIGDGRITSVSSNVELDSGLYVVRTSGVANGVNMAQIPAKGYLVPRYAVNNGAVMVAVDGVAERRAVTVARSDAENALITSGLNDGDIVIISNVTHGARVKIVEK